MVKVENGWESNTLEEIEALTSQQSSPRASLKAHSRQSAGQALRSPGPTKTSSLRRHGSSLSSEGTSVVSQSAQADQRADKLINQQQKTASRSQKQGHVLAPPADIIPGARRRPHHANPPPQGYASVNPTDHTGTQQRTPSQNAAMEADAVETLLFMASPGNSSHHPSTSGGISSSARFSAPTSSQPSPMRLEF